MKFNPTRGCHSYIYTVGRSATVVRKSTVNSKYFLKSTATTNQSSVKQNFSDKTLKSMIDAMLQ